MRYTACLNDTSDRYLFIWLVFSARIFHLEAGDMQRDARRETRGQLEDVPRNGRRGRQRELDLNSHGPFWWATPGLLCCAGALTDWNVCVKSTCGIIRFFAEKYSQGIWRDLAGLFQIKMKHMPSFFSVYRILVLCLTPNLSTSAFCLYRVFQKEDAKTIMHVFGSITM